MVKIGVAGAGAWGRNLIRNIAAGDDTTLAAVCDPSAKARQAAARFAPEKTYESFERMLEDRRLDAVVIATPSAHHFAHAQKALEAGLHVLVEKPMCMTGAEARALIRLADARERVLMVGHTFLYSNLVHEVKRRITSGELGEVYCVYSQRLNLGRVRQDVDTLWNFAPHDISITGFLLDDWPTAVNARGATFIQRALNIADVAFFQMEFADGRMMSGHVSWLDPQKVRRMVVVGSEKMLVYDDVDDQHHIQIYDKSVQLEFQSSAENFSDFRTRIRAGDLAIPNISLIEPLSVEIAHFAQCVRDGSRPHTDGDNGHRVVCVLEAMSRSMETRGASIEVDYGDRADVERRIANCESEKMALSSSIRQSEFAGRR